MSFATRHPLTRRFLLPLAAVAALLAASPAHAQLSLTIFPASLILFPGDSRTVDVTLTNTGLDPLSLVGFSADLTGPDPAGTINWDVDPFEANAPFTLAGGASYSGQMTFFAEPSGGTPGQYVATYTVDAEDTNSDPVSAVATVSLDVRAASIIPEPATLALSAIGLSALALAWRRRAQ